MLIDEWTRFVPGWEGFKNTGRGSHIIYKSASVRCALLVGSRFYFT